VKRSSRSAAAARGTPKSAVVGPSKPRLWNALGPGLITGAADDDPSGIATYSQAGAQFGYQLAWTLVLTYPLMVVIQGICARIGRTTGRGIAGNLREYYSPLLLRTVVGLLFVANTLNIGADLGAMGASMKLLAPLLPSWMYVGAFGLFCAIIQVVLKYTRYVAILKWLTLSLFAYVAALWVVHISWSDLARGILLPTFARTKDFWQMVVAILGTTISPYLFFWQASQEVEDTKVDPVREPLLKKPRQASSALARIQLDTLVGMGFSNLVALAILVTTAATLHAAGVSQIDTAAQAAQALRPVAGPFAFGVFSLGIIGTGLLSIPVLAGSAAYALGEAQGWPVGLAKHPLQAKAFYGAILAATLLGAAANFFQLNPVKALVWSAVLNGIVAVPVMALLLLMSTRASILGSFTISRAWKILGWSATGLMAIASIGFFVSLISD
jgi:NRAMP (natural resistance-associated macrophage protein)-like metal ion transporter